MSSIDLQHHLDVDWQAIQGLAPCFHWDPFVSIDFDLDLQCLDTDSDVALGLFARLDIRFV